MSDNATRPRLKTVTLGCKVNQYETEFVRQGLHRIGFRDAQRDEAADVCVVNTCTVTSEGDAKSRQVIRRLARQNPDSRIVVMGCYATRAPDEVAALPGVAEVVTDKRELPDLLGRFGVTDIPTGIDGFAGRKRAYVKVQDGCLLRCSYCIIPMVRPELTSRPLEDILAEVGRLTSAGHREVILTGIHLGHYGVDWNRHKPKAEWTRLAHLVERLAELPKRCQDSFPLPTASGNSVEKSPDTVVPDFRIRLSSIEATEVTRELIAVLRRFPRRIVPHLHVCLQSGSDPVLRRMRRRWGTRMFLDRCEMLRTELDQPALTTDVIVGFPGETDADFERTLETCRKAGFSKIHVFPFSPRRGTPAAEMSDPVPDAVRSERVAELLRVEAELRRTYFDSLVGRRLQLLVDSVEPLQDADTSDRPQWIVRGTSCRYAPLELVTDRKPELSELIDVEAVEACEDRIRCTRTSGFPA